VLNSQENQTMTKQNEPFDEYGQVSDRFRKDLRALYGPTGSVPPQVDRAILHQAHRRLARPRRIILRIRWAGGIAAAAAAIALGVFLYHGTGSDNHPSAAAERRMDLDGNGRVDILDAFRLARHIESRGQGQVAWASSPWMQNHGQDARATEWDVNGDGRVDRDDVDAIAFAAVRMDKGV
jgi:hypothetical protein